MRTTKHLKKWIGLLALMQLFIPAKARTNNVTEPESNIVIPSSYVKFFDFEAESDVAKFGADSNDPPLSWADNPLKNDVNGSDKVMKFVHPGNWDKKSITCWDLKGNVDFAAYGKIMYRIYHNVDDNLKIKVSKDWAGRDLMDDPGVGTYSIPKGQWSTAVINLPATADEVEDFLILPAFGAYAGGDYYFDDFYLIPRNMSDADIAYIDKEILLPLYAEGDLIGSVTKNLTLPVTGENGSAIVWTSSNPEVIADDGTITRPAQGTTDAQVILTATVTKGEAVYTKEFSVTVLKMPNVPEEYVLWTDFEGTDVNVNDVSGFYAASWADNPSKDAMNDSEKVMKWTRQGDWEKAGLDSWMFANKWDPALYGKFMFRVYQDVADDLVIKVGKNDEELQNPNLKGWGSYPLKRGEWTTVIVDLPTEKPADYTAFYLLPGYGVMAGGDFYFDDFYFVPGGWITDADLLAEDKAALAPGFASGDGINSVTKSLTLASSGLNGSTITWKSSDPDIIAVDGTVTRLDTENATVTLTATLTKGEAIDTKEFTVTVLAKNAPVIAVAKDFETGTAEGFYGFNGSTLTIVDNPLKNDINATGKALKYTRSASNAWDGIGSYALSAYSTYDEMRFLVYHELGDGMTMIVQHNPGGDAVDIATYSLPANGTWGEIVVPAPQGGFKGDLMFLMAPGASIAGDFLLDEITFSKEADPDAPEEVVLFYETFGTTQKLDKPGILANNGEFLIEDPKHYDPVNICLAGNWGGNQSYDSPSGPATLVFNPTDYISEFTIKNINTIGYEDITLSMGMVWEYMTFSYSVDEGASWVGTIQFDGGPGPWKYITPFSDLPAVENLWIRMVYSSENQSGSCLIDDIKITAKVHVDRPKVKPDAPIGLSSMDTDGALFLTWTGVGNTEIEKYLVYRSEAGGSQAGILMGETSITAYALTGLEASSTYRFAVVAVSTDGLESDPSELFTVTTQNVAIEDGLFESVKLFPNPAKSGDQITVTLPEIDGNATFMLSDIAGVVIWQQTTNADYATFTVDAPGTYILQIIINGQKVVRKVVAY